MAGHTQVFPHRLTARSFWDDVVDDQTCSRDGGQSVTIRALITGFSDHALTQSPGNAPPHYSGLCNSSGAGIWCPRHFNTI